MKQGPLWALGGVIARSCIPALVDARVGSWRHGRGHGGQPITMIAAAIVVRVYGSVAAPSFAAVNKVRMVRAEAQTTTSRVPL